MAGGNCTECGKQLGRANKSGLCAPHSLARLNADPKFQAKRIAASRANQPSKEVRRRASKVSAAKRLANPEHRAWLAEHMRAIAPLGQTPEVKARRNATLSVVVSDYRLPWCPREYREAYRALARKTDATTARAVIEAEIARDKAKAAAERDTFEAKLARVQSGKATIAPKIVQPARDYAFSLTGGSL